MSGIFWTRRIYTDNHPFKKVHLRTEAQVHLMTSKRITAISIHLTLLRSLSSQAPFRRHISVRVNPLGGGVDSASRIQRARYDT